MSTLKYGNINDMRGFASNSKLNRKIYDMWKDIFRRCYSGTYPNYKDVTVCNDWFTFSNFVAWVESLDNYVEFAKTFDKISWSIDKDSKNPNVRQYNPNTCTLMTIIDNSREMVDRLDSRQKVLAYTLNGSFIDSFNSINECADTFKTTKGAIIAVCKGRRNNHKGMIFKYKED